ncbi:hypothetical protein EG68_07604 [Paragonimus skrjabini miyazakii]|uniref:NUDE domain-containing protein n=1 Tax=Paragonimus skrjabini miyazakii TaxID=59628 RepID=A0A8S9YQ47_9TREM|nr:hypothetical protein EG68_07604 [Paragonimus skrjabini miyazakii]
MELSPFKDVHEEVAYWRKMADEYKQGLDEVREELDDFQASSKELEYELETQLKQLEKQNHELILLTEKLTSERDHYREKVESGYSTLSQEVERLQEELTVYKRENEKQQRYIREIEQINDDLERAKRAAVVSLEDFESQLNKAIERNAILENELDEKEDLIVTVQRLKEETRDLHQELAITRRQPATNQCTHITNDLSSGAQTVNRTSKEAPAQTDHGSFSASLLTPSVRIAALNMVNDALQKIGHLEFKLSELYRSYGTPPLSAPPNAIAPPNSLLNTVNGGSGKLTTKEKSQATYRRSSSKSWNNGSVACDHGSVPSDCYETSMHVANGQ